MTSTTLAPKDRTTENELRSASTRPLTESKRPNVMARCFRRGVLRRLRKLREGHITICDGPLEQEFGEHGTNSLRAKITVSNPRFYRRAALAGSLGAAESYLDGDWNSDDLTTLFRVFARNLDATASTDGAATAALQRVDQFRHWLAKNTLRGSRKNIEAHYDLGDEFFRLFLDPTMMYSSAIFERDQMSLEDAQIARLDRICRKLDLRPSDHVIEIGTGWGGFALYAARKSGCRVTTTTISKNQLRTAKQRIREAGLENKVTVLDRDYRDLRGKYDKLVSIEMIEAVGHQYFDTFFGQCGNLLKDGGRMLLQAITMPEQRYEQYLRSVDFIQKYIFPGGCLPSVTAMQQSVARQTDLTLIELKDFGKHYARTLREWRTRFRENLHGVRLLGYSDRFVRMWNYYLCYCEAAFEERAVGVVQAVWER